MSFFRRKKLKAGVFCLKYSYLMYVIYMLHIGPHSYVHTTGGENRWVKTRISFPFKVSAIQHLLRTTTTKYARNIITCGLKERERDENRPKFDSIAKNILKKCVKKRWQHQHPPSIVRCKTNPRERRMIMVFFFKNCNVMVVVLS